MVLNNIGCYFLAMRTTQQLSITLPTEMAEQVDRKVRSGAYTSASEVMREGIRALLERDEAVERWLREEVVAGHREYLANPNEAVPANSIVDRIKRRRSKMTGR